MHWTAVAAFLACARIGAVHSVVFAGFSAESLRDRVVDADCRVVITSEFVLTRPSPYLARLKLTLLPFLHSEGKRGGRSIATKAIVDAALKQCPLVEHVLVLQRTGGKVNWTPGRDAWWHEETAKVPSVCPVEIMSSEDPLFILYVSLTGREGRSERRS